MDIASGRRRYAESIALSRGVDDERVVAAFAKVPREHFLGPGPWIIAGRDGYFRSETSDPALLYDDIVVALAPAKRINNGQPTLHAMCLSAARLKPGASALHIGCGSGYYSAIIAELVATMGTVTAWDVEPELIKAAARNLAPWPQARAALHDGTQPPIPASDFIYVSAGCTRPPPAWLEALTEGGRLIFPLTPGWEFGGMLMVTRSERFDARFLSRASFIPCVGANDEAEAARLKAAFERGDMDRVTSLHLGDRAPPDAWFAGRGWWLA